MVRSLGEDREEREDSGGRFFAFVQPLLEFLKFLRFVPPQVNAPSSGWRRCSY